jgi:hypothetical protein
MINALNDAIAAQIEQRSFLNKPVIGRDPFSGYRPDMEWIAICHDAPNAFLCPV